MPTWKAGGYVIRLYQTDHLPLHVHVFHDGLEVARYDLEQGQFMEGSNPRHVGRVLCALKQTLLIDGADADA